MQLSRLSRSTSRAPPVTAAIDDVVFLRPVRVGQVMTVTSQATRVFGSSMEVAVVIE